MENQELIIKRCQKCGAIANIIKDCNCEKGKIICCDEPMKKLEPNTVEAAVEKHKPTYEVNEGKLYVKVNHVMEEEHYIEWICIKYKNRQVITYFKPGEEPQTHCKYEKGAKIYAYCNKHGLWETEVE